MSVVATAPTQYTGQHSTGLLRSALGTFVRGATALPLAVAAVPMALCGLGRPAARAQQRLIRGADADSGRPTGNPLRIIGHSLLVAAPALVSFVATGIALFTVYSGYLYFLRPAAFPALAHPFTTDHRFDGAWGGPTLVGAWLVHCCVALGIQLAALAVVRGLSAVQDALSRRLLTA